MCILKKGILFVWNEYRQWSFDTLKHVVISSPVLQPPYYNRYFLLYLAASNYTIGMVLVQTDNGHNENVIYYFSKVLLNIELRYPYVERLALEVVLVVQWF